VAGADGVGVHQREAEAAGRVRAVNAGMPKLLETAQGPVMSGIVKTPASGPLMLRTLNFDGDRQADPRVHGGPDKAVYCYPFEHYAFWASDLGRAAEAPGCGAARIQVTKPRSPCFKLAGRMGVRGFERRFQRSGRSGWYARVLTEGLVGAGDAVTGESAGDGPTVAEVFRRDEE